MSHVTNKQQLSLGFPIRSDKNRDEQPQKIHVAGSLKFRMLGVRESSLYGHVNMTLRQSFAS